MRPDRRVQPGERRRDPKGPDACTRRDVPTWAARDQRAGVPAPRGLRVPPRDGAAALWGAGCQQPCRGCHSCGICGTSPVGCKPLAPQSAQAHQSPRSSGKCSSLPKAIKEKKKKQTRSWGGLHRLGLPAGPVLSPPAVTHPIPPSKHTPVLPVNTPQSPQYPPLQPSNDLSKYLVQCHALPLLRAGEDQMPSEEEEVLSPAPAPKAQRQRAGSHPRADPGAGCRHGAAPHQF